MPSVNYRRRTGYLWNGMPKPSTSLNVLPVYAPFYAFVSRDGRRSDPRFAGDGRIDLDALQEAFSSAFAERQRRLLSAQPTRWCTPPTELPASRNAPNGSIDVGVRQYPPVRGTVLRPI